MRRLAAGGVVVAALLLAADLRQPPAAQWSGRAAIGAIQLYQTSLSRWYAAMGIECRFTPTCSHYGEETIRRFGAARGSWLAIKRVLRCGPWTPMGTSDPAPAV